MERPTGERRGAEIRFPPAPPPALHHPTTSLTLVTSPVREVS